LQKVFVVFSVACLALAAAMPNLAEDEAIEVGGSVEDEAIEVGGSVDLNEEPNRAQRFLVTTTSKTVTSTTGTTTLASTTYKYCYSVDMAAFTAQTCSTPQGRKRRNAESFIVAQPTLNGKVVENIQELINPTPSVVESNEGRSNEDAVEVSAGQEWKEVDVIGLNCAMAREEEALTARFITFVSTITVNTQATTYTTTQAAAIQTLSFVSAAAPVCFPSAVLSGARISACV